MSETRAECKTFSLKDYQIPHVEKIKRILHNTHCAFDMSMMGTGKTFTTSELCLQCKFTCLIAVCPTTVESRWHHMRDYGIPIYDVVSYQSLRSTKGHQPKHGLLERYDIIKDDGGEDYYFKVTPRFEELVKQGVLVVFDEAQNVKNKSVQAEACKTLASYILSQTGRSRFMLLSGSPIDKEEHAINIMQLMGFIRSHRLFIYHKESDRLELRGAQELVDYCNSVNRELTTTVLLETPFLPKNVRHVCYLLFQRVLKPNITSAMPPPPTNVPIDCKNGYYRMADPDSNDYLSAIEELHHVFKYNESRGTVNVEGENLGAITNALMQVERPKVHTFARKAIEDLEANPNCKVGIFVNYKITLKLIAELLAKYRPLILQGNVPKKKREPIIEKFQAPNTEYRVLISNLKVASTGIDLDDKVGIYPRICYASPSYLISDLHQLTRRFLRMDTKSVAKIRFVYGSCGRRETSILNALALKSTVLKETLETQASHGIVFPGEYEEEVEIEDVSIVAGRPDSPDTPPSKFSMQIHHIGTPPQVYRASIPGSKTELRQRFSDSALHLQGPQRLGTSPVFPETQPSIGRGTRGAVSENTDEPLGGVVPPPQRVVSEDTVPPSRCEGNGTREAGSTVIQAIPGPMSHDSGVVRQKLENSPVQFPTPSRGVGPGPQPEMVPGTSGELPRRVSRSIPESTGRKLSIESSTLPITQVKKNNPNLSPTIGINLESLIRNVRTLKVT